MQSESAIPAPPGAPFIKRHPYAVRLALVACAYYVVAEAGLLLAFENSSVTAVWPATGVALAALILWGPRMWPAVAAGALLANIEIGWAAAAIMVGNTLEAVVGAALLRRVGFRPTFERVRDVLAFVALAAVLSTTISATVGVAALLASGLIEPGGVASAWRVWWFGDAGGDLIAGATLLVLATHGRRRLSLASAGEAALAFVVLAAVCSVAFSYTQPTVYLVYPPLFWIAFRFGQLGAVAAGVVLAMIGITFTVQDLGPLALGSPDSDLVRSQAWAAVAIVSSLLMAAVRTERMAAESERRASELARGALAAERERLKEVVEALKASDALHERIQRIGRIGGWEWDLVTGTVELSPQLGKLLGGASGGPVSELLELVHPEDRPRLEAMLRDSVARRTGFVTEYRALLPDGATIILETAAEIVCDPRGKPVLMRGILQDVTSSRRASETFRQLLEAAPDAMVIVDGSGSIVLVNAQAEELFGYARADLVGESVEMLIPARVRSAHVNHRAGFSDSPSVRPMGAGRELFARRSDGHELPVEVSLSPIDTDKGRVVLSAIRDVSERKRAEQRLRESAARMEEAQEIASFGSWEWTPATGRTTWSPVLYSIYGFDPAEVEPSIDLYLECVHPDDRERVAVTIKTAIERKTAFSQEERIVRPDGDIRLLRSQGRPILDERGEVTRMVGVCQDVTALHAAEEARDEAESRFRSAFENAPIGVALVSVGAGGEAGCFLDVNRSFCRITGYSEEELLRMDPRALRAPGDPEPDPQARERLRSGEVESVTVERRLLRADGETIWTLTNASIVTDPSGRAPYAVIQVQDISERKSFEVQLQYLADHDPLTGLQNRRRFLEELDRRVAHVTRYGGDAAVLVIDLDHFKYVNDTLGHAVGDDLIRRVATLLRERLRETDVVARLGGDEFAVLLPEVEAPRAHSLAAELLTHLRELTVADGSERPIRLSASIGVSPFSADPGLTGEMVLVNADIAMYQAKDAGRDRVALLETLEEPKTLMRARMTWLDRVRRALEEESFALHGQPILDLNGSGLPRYELLLRMIGDRGEVIPPASFLPIAEEFGLIQAVDRWVVGRATKLAAARSRAGNPTVFEVNLSGASITDPAVLDAIERDLDRSGADPRNLIFEVTETAAIVNIERANRFADHLAQLGCGFALDDFGAGFGSFYYLKHLPFDYLKIDGDFIRNLPNSSPDQVTVKAIVQIAQGFDKRTIAEFVQDARTLDLLREYGVDFAQGYHVGRPQPTEDIPRRDEGVSSLGPALGAESGAKRRRS